MSCPRLEIHLDRLQRNAEVLVERLGKRDIGITGITKATLGSPEVARCLLAAGVSGLGDSRVENIERLRAAGITAPITLIRSPMLSQVSRVVAHADTSLNTEGVVLSALSDEAVRQARTHRVILMVELGDLREGILPEDLPPLIAKTTALPNLELCGLGTNLACQHGIAPDDHNMAVLSQLVDHHEALTGRRLPVVSGGNSASYDWAVSTAEPGPVNDLRLGEAILLGCEPLGRTPIDGLRTDAITLVAEVIERSTKPAQAWGTRAQAAFGSSPRPTTETGNQDRAIVAIGHQDIDPEGLTPPDGLTIAGTSSDHLVLTVDQGQPGPTVGDEICFAVNYSALLRAMNSPGVSRVFLGRG
jgi:predicted amino acid racemase